MLKKIILLFACIVMVNINAMRSGKQTNTSKNIFPYNKEQDAPKVRIIIEQAIDNLVNTGMDKGSKEKNIQEMMKYVESKNYKTITYKNNKHIIGFITFIDFEIKKFKIPCTNKYLVNLGRQGAIEVFAVDKNNRKQGVGSILLKYALSEMEQNNTQKITLMTKPANIAAKKLYERLGFAVQFEGNGLTCYQYQFKNKK